MATRVLGTYKPESVDIIISVPGIGSHVVTGKAAGSFVSVSRLVPASTPYIGSDNEGSRVKRSNRSAQIAITLSQTSASNDFFSQLERLDADSDSDSYIFTTFIKDNSGRSEYFANNCFVESLPEVDMGEEMGTKSWGIFTFDLETNDGGNGRLSQDAIDQLEAMGRVIEERWLPRQ